MCQCHRVEMCVLESGCTCAHCVAIVKCCRSSGETALAARTVCNAQGKSNRLTRHSIASLPWAAIVPHVAFRLADAAGGCSLACPVTGHPGPAPSAVDLPAPGRTPVPRACREVVGSNPRLDIGSYFWGNNSPVACAPRRVRSRLPGSRLLPPSALARLRLPGP